MRDDISLSGQLPERIFRSGNNYFVYTGLQKGLFGERFLTRNGQRARFMDPKRSKLAAAIMKGLQDIPLKVSSRVLYLGASSGTTASYVADICPSGLVYAVELSYESFYRLLGGAAKMSNILPILEDANLPERYRHFVDTVDVIYQDISQRNQIQIFNLNAEAFPEASEALLVIKTRSISSRSASAALLRSALASVKGFKTIETFDLRPFDDANYMIHLRRI